MKIIVELSTDNASMETEEEYQLEINRIMQRIGVNLGKRPGLLQDPRLEW